MSITYLTLLSERPVLARRGEHEGFTFYNPYGIYSKVDRPKHPSECLWIVPGTWTGE